MFNKDIEAIAAGLSESNEQIKEILIENLKEQNQLLIDKTKKEIADSEDKVNKINEMKKLTIENLERSFQGIIEMEMNHREGLRGMLEELETK